MAGSRREKVSDLIQAEVARLLQQEVHDARLGFVTVTGVTVSPDLRHARVHVSTLAEGEARAAALSALKAARGFVRRRLGQELRLRYTPDIEFRLDTSLEQGARIERLIEDLRAPGGPADEADEE
ncbi:MAG TPA: 30S ribosome-binding factor RbfA [Candidatus Polarisedimenticolia bacterium]|nr:30S ribosome-binding factor RbfA [Candidatus Polarisedimenticolia bacterium]